MPTRVFVHVLQARSLPVMDRASGLCDAYVKPQLKGVVFEPAQTQIAKKTLNPVWNQDLRCDVSDDCLLQVKIPCRDAHTCRRRRLLVSLFAGAD